MANMQIIRPSARSHTAAAATFPSFAPSRKTVSISLFQNHRVDMDRLREEAQRDCVHR